MPAEMDFDRPCTLLTPHDASQVLNRPFLTTMATDSVEDNHVRCAQAVGEGGLHGVAELYVEFPKRDQTAELHFLSLCRSDASSPALPGMNLTVDGGGATAAQRPVSAAPRDIVGRACRLSDGGYAMLLPDRVLRVQVRDGTGSAAPEAAHLVARLVSQRVAAQRS
ncbi:MAG: hypothetical protein GC189_12905 [Alphaproteobacteria bacterium]|nr:hypothetical protein [Alphaproteobacteria bacterium]